jgi:hypothetical protein
MWIKVIKWLAVVAVALGMVWGVYSLGHAAGQAEVTAVLSDYKRESFEKQLQVWSAAQQELHEVEEKYLADAKKQQAKADGIIADYKRGAIRLRESLRCTTAVPSGDSAGSGDAAGAGGLQATDVEDLIRLADRADRAAEQLAACQQAVRGLSR